MTDHITLKVFAGLAAIASIWLDFRPNKRKQNADPAIAEADERERHSWRYPKLAVRTIQFLLGVWLLWQVVSFILT
jgi:hypothetical protein